MLTLFKACLLLLVLSKILRFSLALNELEEKILDEAVLIVVVVANEVDKCDVEITPVAELMVNFIILFLLFEILFSNFSFRLERNFLTFLFDKLKKLFFSFLAFKAALATKAYAFFSSLLSIVELRNRELIIDCRVLMIFESKNESKSIVYNYNNNS